MSISDNLRDDDSEVLYALQMACEHDQRHKALALETWLPRIEIWVKDIERLTAELSACRQELAQAQKEISTYHCSRLELIQRAESAEAQLLELSAKCAEMASALSYYATTRETYADKAEGAWLLAEQALANLPAEAEKLVRLVGNVEKMVTLLKSEKGCPDFIKNVFKAYRDLRGEK